MKRLLALFLFPAALAFPASFLSFGIKGGVPFNDAFKAATEQNIHYVTNTNRYTFGPTLDINLPFGLAIEADLLYRRLHYTATTDTFSRLTTANAWDLPLLLKIRFAPGPIRPYVSAGPTFRGLTNIGERIESFGSSSNPSELKDRFSTGFTVSGGVQLIKHISPELRYTRWGWANFRSVSGLFQSNPDQLEVLVGITF
jgi:opacity protein-like surface antigen